MLWGDLSWLQCCFDFRLEMPFSSQGFNWCFLLWQGLGAAGLRESFAPLPLESWACFGLGLLSSVQRCWWGLTICLIWTIALGVSVPDSCHLSSEAMRLLSGLVFFPTVLVWLVFLF
ncbi:hypothetical protein NC653_021234 [Populus alba x Populus x berolinensis]|uniref:Uncharacterized protein n=1 Tax=Populus alba x Populus x berolinensis TaxID=444605 RepID=A0AAD6QDK7_9ROSI|nr:hypothetical protein NC653_021234 [Populus alba x Populus x berolinensis]